MPARDARINSRISACGRIFLIKFSNAVCDWCKQYITACTAAGKPKGIHSTMNRWKGVLLAAAPITILLILAGGARFLPSVLQTSSPDDDKEVLPPRSPSQSGKSRIKPKPIPEKPADAKTQSALKKIVNGQLDAFAKNDFAAALHYSGAEFQSAHSPEAFQQLIQGGFADLLQAKSVRFVTAHCSADRAMMPAFVTTASGQEVSYIYIFHRSPAAPVTGTKGASVPQKPGEETPDWYIEGVSPAAPRGFPGAGQPGPPRMTNVRDL